MAEFPNNFDYVIYGTGNNNILFSLFICCLGLVESILSAALSTTGSIVLHLDK